MLKTVYFGAEMGEGDGEMLHHGVCMLYPIEHLAITAKLKQK